MAFRVGSGSICQAAEQSNWGVPVAPTTLLNMTGESVSVSREMGDEGNLLATKTAAQRDLLAIVTDGGIDQVLRPETADWLFKMAMGVESVSGSVHTFTLAAPNTQLPFSTIVMDRGGIVKNYPDVTIRSLTIEAPAQDYVRANIDFVGTMELNSNDADFVPVNTALAFTKPSYRCTEATLVYGAAGGTPATQLCVESCSITIDNAIEDAPATYCSGLYNERPLPGLRSVTVNATVPYDTALDTFRDTYYIAGGVNASLKLTFTTSNSSETVVINIPHLSLTEAGGNVNGTGIIDASFSGEALSVGATEPITVVVTHV